MVGRVDICPQAKMLCTEDPTIWLLKPSGPRFSWKRKRLQGNWLVSLYPYWHRPLTPRSTIQKGSRKERYPEEAFPPGIDLATKAISQECSTEWNLPQPFTPQQQPQALLCSAHKPLHCLDYLIPRTQERDTDSLPSLITASVWTKAVLSS